MYDMIIGGFIDMMDPEGARRRADAHRQWCRDQLHLAEPWRDDIKGKKVLVIKAETYKPIRLFPRVKRCRMVNVNDATMKQIVTSPTGKWGYVEKICPPAMDIPLAYGRERGVVIFDDEVIIPALFEEGGGERWKLSPWMSITPMEMMTLRPGTKRAKGHTIVAGLGLGHQLIEVSRRRQVTKITLVERDKELVDWLLPVIHGYMGHARHSMEVVVGDAYKVMPKMRADVALVDIFPGFGGNEYRRDELRKTCPNIGFIWGWGCGAYR